MVLKGWYKAGLGGYVYNPIIKTDKYMVACAFITDDGNVYSINDGTTFRPQHFKPCDIIFLELKNIKWF